MQAGGDFAHLQGMALGTADQPPGHLAFKIFNRAEPALKAVFLLTGKFKNDQLGSQAVVPRTGLEPVSL